MFLPVSSKVPIPISPECHTSSHLPARVQGLASGLSRSVNPFLHSSRGDGPPLAPPCRRDRVFLWSHCQKPNPSQSTLFLSYGSPQITSSCLTILPLTYSLSPDADPDGSHHDPPNWLACVYPHNHPRQFLVCAANTLLRHHLVPRTRSLSHSGFLHPPIKIASDHHAPPSALQAGHPPTSPSQYSPLCCRPVLAKLLALKLDGIHLPLHHLTMLGT